MIHTREAWRLHYELLRLVPPLLAATWKGDQTALATIESQVNVLHARRDALREELKR